ncbi:MAG TPA: EamA family transporter [Lacunisphaera sp.]
MSTAGKTPTKAAIIAGFATIYLLWGSTYLGIKIAVETLPPFLMASARFFVAGTIVTVWIACTGRFKATRRQWIDNSLIGGFLLLGGNGVVSWSEQKIPSGVSTLVVSLGPLFIVLLDWAVFKFSRDKTRGTRPTWTTFVGVGLGIVGLVVLVAPNLGEGQSQLDPWRASGLVLACFSWSVGSIYTRYARTPAEPFTAAAIQMLAGSVWLIVVSLLMGEPEHFRLSAASSRSLFAWGYLIVAGSLVGFTTFVWLMKHCTPARVSTFAYVNPVVAVFLGWMLAHETVGPTMLIAAAIIIAGVAIITASKSKKPVPDLDKIEIGEAAPATGVGATKIS